MCVEERLETGNLLQRISDAIKRPFYSGAGACTATMIATEIPAAMRPFDGGRARVISQETHNKLTAI